MLRGVGVPPPPITPRVGDEVAPEYVVAAAIEPKFVELPLVAIVIESIVLIRVGAVFPPADIALIEFEHAVLAYLGVDNSPKSCEFPVVVILSLIHISEPTRPY